MNAPTRPTRLTRPMQRTALVVAATTAALLGAVGTTGVATAAPSTSDGTVQYSPTLTTTPGFGCFAVINTTKLPQTRSGSYRVKVNINRFGFNCGAFKLAVNWKNVTTGDTGGQIQTVLPNGTVEQFPDNVLEGFGFAPGPGKVISTIITYSKYDEEGDIALPNIPGRASFTLS